MRQNYDTIEICLVGSVQCQAITFVNGSIWHDRLDHPHVGVIKSVYSALGLNSKPST